MERDYLNYEPHTLITYNEKDDAYGEVMPKTISANDVSVMARRMKRTSQELADMKLKVEHVKEYLLEAYDDLGESAQEIADWLDIELTKDVSVTVTVEFEVQLSVKPDEDLDDILMNLEYSMENHDSVIEYYSGDVTWQES
jgi:hypothetical protein